MKAPSLDAWAKLKADLLNDCLTIADELDKRAAKPDEARDLIRHLRDTTNERAVYDRCRRFLGEA